MIVALVFFALASITDFLDGRIARKNNLVTTFGKFLDPLADKLLVMTALITFTFERWIDPIAVVVILSREFMVTGLRLVVAEEGVVVAAGIWGKLKTAFTMVAIIAILFWLFLFYDLGIGFPYEFMRAVEFILVPVLVWISTILTVISGAVYLKGYWHLIDSDK
jgi:CDP-diacylglycerol--glycerol-3-phosphate 3-phosphatidyltransferase